MAKIALYTDKPGHRLEEVDLHAIMKYFEVDVPVFLNAESVRGFESGINWESIAERGITAVVLYDVNDACSFGISLLVVGERHQRGAVGVQLLSTSRAAVRQRQPFPSN